MLNAVGDALTYGEVAEAASKLPVPEDVPLKPAGEFKRVGTRAPRTDSAGKVDGSAQFGLDVQLPGMRHAALAQCPAMGGTIRRVDAAVAEAMPGVRHVLTTTLWGESTLSEGRVQETNFDRHRLMRLNGAPVVCNAIFAAPASRPLAEYGGTDPEMRGALGDRGCVVAAHPHRQRIEPVAG